MRNHHTPNKMAKNIFKHKIPNAGKNVKQRELSYAAQFSSAQSLSHVQLFVTP